MSVNPWGDAAQNMQQDAAKWKLVPQWRWGIAPRAVLARVWRDYDIGVRVAKRTVAGVTVREIAHTEATYLVDGSGHERAVFVYPFHAADVLRASSEGRPRRETAERSGARPPPGSPLANRLRAAAHLADAPSKVRPHDGHVRDARRRTRAPRSRPRRIITTPIPVVTAATRAICEPRPVMARRPLRDVVDRERRRADPILRSQASTAATI